MPVLRARLAVTIGLATAAMGIAETTFGADLGSGPPPPPPSAPYAGWTLNVTPYAWAPFIQGDVTVKGRTVDVDVNPIELLGDLDAVPFMAYTEARKGPLVLYNDIVYANVGVDGSVSRAVGGLTVGASADVDVTLAIIEVGGAFEIARWSGGRFGPYTAVDVLAGARYWHEDVDLKFGLTGALDLNGVVVSRNRAIARSGGVDWVDPLVGFRIRQGLAPGQELLLRADVGGFDVGSQFSWNVQAAYSFVFAVRDGVTYSGMLGYRALSADFEKGSGTSRFKEDIVLHGPVVGLTLRF